MLAIVAVLVGAIAAALYLGVFSPHPQVALDTFNEVYGTKGARFAPPSSLVETPDRVRGDSYTPGVNNLKPVEIS